MRQPAFAGLAAWLLRRLASAYAGEALAGDLLEEFRAGHTAGWYWRQVAWAAGGGSVRRSRRYLGPTVFAAVWSLLYPVWLVALRTAAVLELSQGRAAQLDWPYSSVVQIVDGLAPAVSFVWLGLLLYLGSRGRAGRVPFFRWIGSLSLSLNVLLVAAIGFLGLLGFSGADPLHAGREGFYLAPYHLALSLPLALSLWSAMLCVRAPIRTRAGRLAGSRDLSKDE